MQATTTQGSPTFVPPAERIATFDQDGTLWVEKPMYSQVLYCLDRVPAVVKAKPELANEEPFKTVMSGDREAISKLPQADLFKILAATLTGMSVEDFRADVTKWLAGALDGFKFGIGNARKDLRYYTHLAESLPVASFLGEATHQSLVQAVNLGYGDKLIASLFEAQEKINDVKIVPR